MTSALLSRMRDVASYILEAGGGSLYEHEWGGWLVKPKVVWITGLPCSGKTTIANRLRILLRTNGADCCVLDGDEVRMSALSSDLGFSPEDRKKNLFRVSFVAELLLQYGVWVVCAFVSPDRGTRDMIRRKFAPGCFAEVYLECSPEECAARDTKGLWAKAKAGEIKGFTGHDAPYNPPIAAEVVVDTEHQTIDQCVEAVWRAIWKPNT